MVHFQKHLFQKFKTLFIQLQNTLSYIQYSCYDWISQKICFQEDLLPSKKNETFCPIHYMHTVTDLQLPDNKMQPGASCTTRQNILERIKVFI